MLSPEQEKQLILVAVGVVVCTVLAIIVFIINAGAILFYLFAIIAIILGFYLSYNLSREQPRTEQQNKKKK